MTAADYRNNRMEDAIEKLTEVSSDLNKVIAVHEQRLNQQEKQMGNLETVVERRREESEIKLKDVFNSEKRVSHFTTLLIFYVTI